MKAFETAIDEGIMFQELKRPYDRYTDLRNTLASGCTSITITAEDQAEGWRVVDGWPDEKVREFAVSWIARAEARQRLVESAIDHIRTLERKSPNAGNTFYP